MIRLDLTAADAEHLFRALDQVVRAGGIDAAEVLGPIAGKLRSAYAAHKTEAAEAAQRDAFARYEAEKVETPA
jgi:hypothetical protein